jgi:hypothetical protein
VRYPSDTDRGGRKGGTRLLGVAKKMGIFDGIENVEAEGASSLRQYFEPGCYVVTIERVFLHEKRLGGGKLFIVETIVNESDNLNIKPGEQHNWAQSFAIPYALPRIKSFIGAAMGLCPQKQLKEINAKVTEAVCNKAVGSENPLRSKKLKLTCIGKTTSKGKLFVQHVWGPHDQAR